MKESAWFVVAVAMLTVAAPAAVGLETGAADADPADGVLADVCRDREFHPPIHVADREPLEEDDPRGFVVENPVTGQAESRPGSGVVAGDGSETDPYVIEGWCIVSWWEVVGAGPAWDATEGFDPHRTRSNSQTALDALRDTGIHLDTDAHVVVQDVLIAGFGTGLHGTASPNVTLTDSEIQGNVRGVEQVPLVRGNTISENHHGIYQDIRSQLENLEITRNTIVDNFGSGIVDQSAPQGTVVTENVVSRNWVGMKLTGLDILLEDNHVTENEKTGIQVGEEVQFPVSGNIRNNTVVDNGGPGLRIAGGFDNDLSPITLRGNNIHGNVANLGGTGVKAEGEGTLDARENWWGCPDGPVLTPSLTECQRVFGPVDYDPWLTAPNPDAGAH